jgi:hypothetical protein
VKDFCDDLPTAIKQDQRQEVGKVLFADGAFDLCECRDRPGEFDRLNPVGACLAPASW